MKGPKKPTKVPGFIILFYKCPYCREEFSGEDIKTHTPTCFRQHREAVRRTCSERGKRNYKEGKILKHIRRKDNE